MAGFPEIPGYELQAELGRGGMAVVYSAVETNLGRQVAIKVVTGLDGAPVGQIERLEIEARGLAALHHPHIVDLYRFGRTSDGSLFYVMPLLPGGSLEDWSMPVSEERVVALLENLLDALSHAHAADIVHRDIKPANILFDQHGRPLLADFGAAFVRGRTTRLTDHGTAIGSSGYMSPEQARGLDVDARSDLYSTAVLAFEMLTGKRPFEGPDDLSTAIAQIEQPVPRLPDALRHWQAFFYRALAVNPEHRFGSASAMRSAIRALRQAPTADTRRRTLWTLVAGVAVLALLAFAISWWNRPSNAARGEAVPVIAHTPHPTPTNVPEAISDEAKRTDAIEVPALAKVGDHFSDASGPELVLAREATTSRPALAVMAAAVDIGLFQRFAKDRGRAALDCAHTPAPAQGCLDLAAANELAGWLAKQTGRPYRLPTRAELGAAMPQVSKAPAYAWTSTCNEVSVVIPRKAGSRAWSRVKKVFGGKPTPRRVETRCEGNFALKLDGKGGLARARSKSAPDSVVVLVRELAQGERPETIRK
jgi:serine/threonine protein kinase